MIAEYVATLLTPVVSYFLYNIHQDIKQMDSKVDQLNADKAATEVKLAELERRVTQIELKQHTNG